MLLSSAIRRSVSLHKEGLVKNLILAVAMGIVAIAFPLEALALSDNEIRDRMISASIRNYSGSCPCPYNSASNGSRCGGRSAYSRPGGASPLCYRSDISQAMVERYRERFGLVKKEDGLSRSDIRKIQSILSDKGFEPGPVDGLMGPSTSDAIERYQEANDLTVDGEPTPALLELLTE